MLVAADLFFQFIGFNILLLIAKNSIPVFLIYTLVKSKNHTFDFSDRLLLAAFILLIAGLNFSYFFYEKSIYLPGITIIYFFEIQIHIYLVLSILKKQENQETKILTKTFIIFSLGLFFIIVFFPLFSFPVQILFFIRVFQYAYFISIVFGNKRVNTHISLSLWFIIQSNISLLVDMVIWHYNFEYAFIMLFFYTSKYFYLSGYIKMRLPKSKNPVTAHNL